MSNMVQVAVLRAEDEAEWEGFVARAPEATFFHRAGWRRVIARSYGHDTPYLIARHGGRVVGVLPLVHLRSPLFGKALISTGFCVYGGILAEDTETARALAARAEELGRELGVDYVELRQISAAPIDWPLKSDLYVTFRRELPLDEDENLKAIPRKKRADVRKGIKAALPVDTDADIATFFRIYSESVRNLGTPVFPKRFFAEIKREFGKDVEISAVHTAEGPVSALMSFFFRDEVLPYFGGGLPSARASHAYDHMYWSLMRRAVARGVRRFDFGRSKRGTGAFDYKRYWGFEPESLHYQYCLIRAAAIPDVNPLNPKYRLMVAAWKRLPLPLANALGPRIASQLG